MLVAGVMCVVVVALGPVCNTMFVSCIGWCLTATCGGVVDVSFVISNLSGRGGRGEVEGAEVNEYWEVSLSSACSALLLLRLLVLLSLRLLDWV